MNLTILTKDDLIWSLGTPGSHPYFEVGLSYTRHYTVDPYPAYPPDEKIVREVLEECDETFPLIMEYDGAFVLPYDFDDHINGLAFHDVVWKRKDGSEWKELIPCYCGCGEERTHQGTAITIVFGAKKIPIHPAMVRYVVAHEFGHGVCHRLARALGYMESEHKEFEAKYMAVRAPGFDYAKKYKGGTWHITPGEVMANDFRTLVMNKEWEFWPHPVDQLTPEHPAANWWRASFEKAGVKPRF